MEHELETWYEKTGGKPIWVTEFACNPWAERACNASLHARLMDQVVPVLEASPLVFRYAWFAAVWKSDFGRPTPSTRDFHTGSPRTRPRRCRAIISTARPGVN